MTAHITGWITRGATARAVSTPTLPADREAVLQAVLHPARLPSVPAIAVKVAEVTTRPDCMPGDVGSVIAGDPAFTAALFQAVNSARAGASRNVASVDRAILVAGLNKVRLLALSLSLPAMRPQSRFVPAAREHSLASVAGAIFARELAVRLGRPEPEEDLNAALLRDLGVLLLQQTYPAAWDELQAHADDPLGAGACARERERIGVDHADVGAEALRRWGLPDDLVEPVRHHHHPERLAGRPHADRAELVWFAGLLTRLEHVAEHPDALDRVLAVAAGRFGLGRAKLADFLDDVRPKIGQFAEALNREIGGCPDYASLLTAATRELSRLSPV